MEQCIPIKQLVCTTRYLCYIYNRCVTTGSYPDTLKIAKVTPCYKAGDKNDITIGHSQS